MHRGGDGLRASAEIRPENRRHHPKNRRGAIVPSILPRAGYSMSNPASDLDALRDRLITLRADALRQLAEASYIDTGLLRLAADASTVLAALDDAEAALPD
jgi:hypothetical protein